jgi:hypothetical protein
MVRVSEFSSFVAVLTVLLTVHAALVAGVGKNEVRYLGGVFEQVKQGAEGEVAFKDDVMVFTWREQQFPLAYRDVTSIEYGQKVGRRIGATIGWGATTLGLAALPMLLSKKRKHFATIGYKDKQGKPQGLVLEFGKNVNRSALKMISLKSGVPIEFETEQAAKEFRH